MVSKYAPYIAHGGSQRRFAGQATESNPKASGRAERAMKKRDAVLVALIVLGATGTGPCAAHEAPRLVEYFQGVEHVPNTGEATSARSAVESSTLDAIHDDPSAVDVQVGMAFPDAVRSARAPVGRTAWFERCRTGGDRIVRKPGDRAARGRRLQRVRAERVAGIGDLAGGHGQGCGGHDHVRERGLRGASARRRAHRGVSRRHQRVAGSRVRSHTSTSPESLHERSKESATGTTEQDPSRDTAGSRAAQDTGEVIDVLVAYTERARSGAGNIDLVIRQFFDDTNRYYSYSQIRTRVRLAHSLSDRLHARYRNGERPRASESGARRLHG